MQGSDLASACAVRRAEQLDIPDWEFIHVGAL